MPYCSLDSEETYASRERNDIYCDTHSATARRCASPCLGVDDEASGRRVGNQGTYNCIPQISRDDATPPPNEYGSDSIRDQGRDCQALTANSAEGTRYEVSVLVPVSYTHLRAHET